MQLTFNKDWLPGHATAERLMAGFPQMFIFVKEENGQAVFCHQESLTGTIRHVPEDKVYTDVVSHVNYNYLIDGANKGLEKGATHLITGFYDVLRDKWNESDIFELSTIDVPFVKKVFDTSLTKQQRLMFSDELLLKANLNYASNMLMFSIDDPRLNVINVLEVYDLMKTYFKESKSVKIGEDAISYESFAKKVFDHFDLIMEPSLFFNFIMSLRGYDLGDVVFYNTENKVYDFFDGRLGTIDIIDLFNPDSTNEFRDKTFPVGVYSTRFLSVMDNAE